ncbi:hypothetical protein F511_43024 [Dorcoceras hygrometricum]|uniref:Uncharacterized protein n=1 Tax=Dorcoceras hygrometricum TaxID=472368 RepID=A0A2Z7B5R1_9LAMI|nr:hypothetical protein F511_43024 [Dorcoceras hygrometricum]
MEQTLLVGQFSFCSVNRKLSSQTQLLLSQQTTQQSTQQSNSASAQSADNSAVNSAVNSAINSAINSALTNENSDFGNENSDFGREFQLSVSLQALFCTDISVEIWVYGIFRTLSYVM